MDGLRRNMTKGGRAGKRFATSNRHVPMPPEQDAFPRKTGVLKVKAAE
jgi:hypothetical protein